MKPRIPIFLAMLAISLSPALADAQTAVGARAGLRSAQLETVQATNGIQNLVIGGYFGIGLSDRLALQLEVAYGTRGGDGLGIGTDELSPGADPVGLRMTYLDIPFLLRSGFPGERFLPSFFLGPYAGFLLGCEIEDAGAAWSCDADPETTMRAARFNPRSTDFGILAGAALDMALGQNTVFVDLRYTVGLLSIMTGEGAAARHSGLEVSGGFAFPLGR